MSDYRNVGVLFAAVAFIQLAGGILGVVTPLGLELLGVNALNIGLIAALNAAGYMIGAMTATQAIALFGNIRLFSAAAGFAWMFSSIESWLGAAVPAKQRGGVTGFYHLISKAALVIGPFFVAGLMPTDFHPVLWCALFLALALLPVCLTRRTEPPSPETTPLPLRRLIDLAPAGVAASFLAGVINSGVMSLLPIYASMKLPIGEGGITAAAALAAAAAWTGGMISQWPAGRLSDGMDRRLVIAAMAGTASIAAFVLAFLPNMSTGLILTLLAVWGAGSLSFYSVAVAHTIDRAPPGQIARVMSGLLFAWAVGSVIGPLLAGVSMRTPMGAGGLFLFASIMGVVLVGAMFWRRARRDVVDMDDQERWTITLPTTQNIVEIDPRAD